MNPEAVLESYTKVAPRYDRVVSFWARATFFPLERYRQEAVSAMNIRRGSTVLEIGCGTGMNFPYIQERLTELAQEDGELAEIRRLEEEAERADAGAAD